MMFEKAVCVQITSMAEIFITVITFPVSVLGYFVCITIRTPASLLHFQREMSKGGSSWQWQ